MRGSRFRTVFAACTLAILIGGFTAPSWAGSLTAPGVVEIWWDDAVFQESDGSCNRYSFNYRKSVTEDLNVSIEFPTGDKLRNIPLWRASGDETWLTCDRLPSYSGAQMVIKTESWSSLGERVLAKGPVTFQPWLDKAAVGKAYLNMVCPANAASERYDKAVSRASRAGMTDGSKIPADVVKALRQSSTSKARAARQLLAYPWPKGPKPDAVVGDAYLLKNGSKRIAATYYEDAAELAAIARGGKWRNPNWASSDDYASKIRLFLGLPPASVNNDGCPK